MKNLLKASYFLILFGFLCLNSAAKSDDTGIFLKSINKAGFKTDIFTSTIFDSKIKIFKTNKNAFIESFSLPNSFYLTNLKDLGYKNIFIVCNSTYEEEGIFKCSNKIVEDLKPENFKYELIELNDSKNKEKVMISIYSRIDEADSIFVLPSNSFENNIKIGLLSNYLSSIYRSSKISVDNPNLTKKTFSQNMEDFLKSTSLELLIYSLVSLVIILFIGKLVIYIKNNRQNIDIKKVNNLSSDLIFGSFSININTKSFFLISIIFYFFLILQFISSTIESKTEYLKQMAVNILEFNMFAELSNKNYDRLIFYSYTYFVFFLILTSRFEYFFEFFQGLFKKIKNITVSNIGLKYCFIIFNFLCIVLFIVFNKFFSFELLLYVLLANLYIVFMLYKEKVDLFLLFTKKEKILILSTILLFSFGVFYYQNFSLRSVFRFEDLIGVPDRIVSLPYKKQTSDSALFNSLSEYNINYPLFIDEFLIYHPNYKKFINKNISKFDENNSNFIILSKSYERLIKGLLSNPVIIKNIEVSNFKNLVFIENPDANNISQLILNADLNCIYKTTNTFKVKVYYFEGTSFRNIEYDLGNVLGCNSVNQKYSFKLPPEISSKDFFMFEFSGMDRRFINTYKFENEENSLALKISEIGVKNNLYFYVTSNLTSGSEITNYTVSDKSDISFDNSDITENLNKLKRDKYIGNTFNVWSLEPYRLIVNEFDSK